MYSRVQHSNDVTNYTTHYPCPALNSLLHLHCLYRLKFSHPKWLIRPTIIVVSYLPNLISPLPFTMISESTKLLAIPGTPAFPCFLDFGHVASSA